jgi:hypothetical protein
VSSEETPHSTDYDTVHIFYELNFDKSENDAINYLTKIQQLQVLVTPVLNVFGPTANKGGQGVFENAVQLPTMPVNKNLSDTLFDKKW